ncbi:MAG: MarR family transcriptional regulator [Hellea sp.]
MATHKDRQLVGLKSKVKFDPPDYFDTAIANLSEIIGKDINAIIRKYVVPKFTNECGLKHSELRILTCLSFYEAALTPADISSLLRYDPATVTRAVSLMEKAGFLTRENYVKDTRSVLLELTSKGTILASRYTECTKEILETLEDTLSYTLTREEKISSITLLYKLAERAKKMRQNSKYLSDFDFK